MKVREIALPEIPRTTHKCFRYRVQSDCEQEVKPIPSYSMASQYRPHRVCCFVGQQSGYRALSSKTIRSKPGLFKRYLPG
jgi:hypothetical protein